MDAGPRDSAGQSPVKHLDVVEKIKREEAEYQAKRSAMNNTLRPTAASSPYPGSTCQYPLSTAPIQDLPNRNGVVSPPTSRRGTQDDKDNPQRSLPSLAEALGARPSAYPRSPGSPPPDSFHRSIPPPSSPPGAKVYLPHEYRARELERPPSRHQSYMHQPHVSTTPSQPLYGPANVRSRTPTQPYRLQTSQAATPTQSAYPSAQSPSPWTTQPYSRYESYQRPQSPPRTYSQQPTPQQYFSQPPSRSFVTTYPTYSPSTARAPHWPNSASEHYSDAKKHEHGRSGQYGESVKRHLDTFDYENTLNEVHDASTQLLSFSETWRNRAHHMPRTGPSLRSMPQIPDVDDMMKQCGRVQESLSSLRERIEIQQAELAEQSKRETAERMAHGRSFEEPVVAREESKIGGFAGGDSKKRRGRAAPPGRCHSCNRAETPEWRRGPDGARTLCNACGLHYAKLTRKMGASNAAVGSSNLRPKSMDRS